MDKRQYIKEIKEIAELLATIDPDKTFVIEAIDAVTTVEELTQLHNVLSDSPCLVRAEVYDALSNITHGRFAKNMPESRILKEQYLRTKQPKDLEKLLYHLCTEYVYSIENWDLKEEELFSLQNAKVGDDLHIESKSIPAVFKLKEQPSIIRIYTSTYEIPHYLTSKYTVAQRPLRYMWKACAILKEALKESIVLALDYDSDNHILQDKTWDVILANGEADGF